jgi:hypothetical protein
MHRLLRRLARTAPGPLAVRAMVFFATAAGLWIASPAAFVSFRLVLAIVIVALLPALVPNGRVVGTVLTGIVALWAVSTLAFGEQADASRTFAVACALYLTHSGAALAAMIPYDAVVDNQVIIRWAGRAVLVIASSAVITAFIVIMAPRLTPTTSILVLIGGLAVVAALVAILAKAAGLRRP